MRSVSKISALLALVAIVLGVVVMHSPAEHADTTDTARQYTPITDGYVSGVNGIVVDDFDGGSGSGGGYGFGGSAGGECQCAGDTGGPSVDPGGLGDTP